MNVSFTSLSRPTTEYGSAYFAHAPKVPLPGYDIELTTLEGMVCKSSAAEDTAMTGFDMFSPAILR